MTRLRLGEWLAGAGAVALLVLMFFDWFAGPGGGSGWATLGWFMDALVGVLIVGGLALSYMTITRASPAWPIGAGVLAGSLGSLILLVLLVRVTIAQPGPDAFVAVQTPAYLGLVAAALVPIGGMLSIRDERTDSTEAAEYVPPPARSVPGT